MKLFQDEEEVPKESIPRTIAAWIVAARDGWLTEKFGTRGKDGYRCAEATEESVRKHVHAELDRQLPHFILKGIGLKKATYGDSYEVDEYGMIASAIKRVAADAVGRVIGSSIEKALDDAIGKSGKLPKKLEEIVLAKFEASFVRALETEAANLGHQAAKDHVARIYAEQITPTFVEDLAAKAVATEPA